jgi:hypothetical protein
MPECRKTTRGHQPCDAQIVKDQGDTRITRPIGALSSVSR